MKKMVVLITIIFVVIGCVPTMAQMVELGDSELELITGQASSIGVPQTFAGVDTSQVRYNIQMDSLDMDTLAQGLQGSEFEMARTIITIDSISTHSMFGQVEARGITVDMEAGTTVRFF
ncbi:MAG: hypothetical protein JEZ02_06485 [Desulfatibacillum sp.]|nr:hypothetical protein [Desulfatibacillum sp.]